MQEEIEKKAVNLAVTTAKISVAVLVKAIAYYLRARKNKAAFKNNTPVGKQSVKELIGQNQGVTSMPIGETGLKDFQRIAKKYGVDFAVVKDKTGKTPKYICFFKARDVDALSQILKEYSQKQIKKQVQKNSVLGKLKIFKELVANVAKKAVEKTKEQMR